MLIPVVLSGGAGTRLWPVSREGHPKPFIRLPDGRTLLERTYRRALACADVAEVITVTNRDYYFSTKDCWTLCTPEVVQSRMILEPTGRNTAPAILLAALDAQARHGSDAILLVLPADHLVESDAAFVTDVEAAVALARRGYLVTFGISPRAPETGFGYIRRGFPIDETQGFQIASFIEKPSVDRARALIDEGGCYWNSGMFCFSVQSVIDAFDRYMPEMLRQGEACWTSSSKGNPAPYLEIGADKFVELDDISIDYAVMEKAANVAVVPATFDWSDIGSWSALADLFEPDEKGNRHSGEVINVDSQNCFIQSGERLVATVGLEDIIVVDTPDALLVSRRDRVQDVRRVVKQLKDAGHESYKFHRTVIRPWGSFTVLEEGPRYKIKRIEVKPGASLSLQMHHHRSEHWIVVSGMAKVTNGEREFLVAANESTYIPAGHRHRLENPGVLDLVMIEVQSGEYLGEDDIVRFQDSYGRA